MTLICAASVGVEVGAIVADGVSVSLLVGEGGMGVSVTGTSNGSGTAVSVDINPCPAWLQELNKIPNATIRVKTRLFHFSKVDNLQAISFLSNYLNPYRHAS